MLRGCIEYAGAFRLILDGVMTLYCPGPGVLARSSEKPPVFERPVIEYDAADVLLATLEPSIAGRV